MNDTAQLDASTATTPTQGDNSGAAPTPVNSGVGAAPQVPPTSAPPAGAEATPGQPPAANAAAADKGENPPASLTNPKAVASTAPDPAAAAKAAASIDPAQNDRDAAGRWGRERQRLLAETERMQSQMMELQQFREETMRKAEQAKLKRWDHQHPDQRKFSDLLSRRERARQQAVRGRGIEMPEGLTPDQQRAIRKQIDDVIAGDFTPEEQAELGEFDQFQRESLHGLTTNMPATIGRIVQPMIRQQFQAMMHEMRLEREVHRDMQDPTLKPLIDRFGDDMAKAMEQGTPYDQALHYTKVYGAYEQALAENARLKQQLEAASGKVSEATVQQELAKGKASITRDVKTPPRNSFLEARKWARENGHDTDSDAFRAKLRQLEGNP